MLSSYIIGFAVHVMITISVSRHVCLELCDTQFCITESDRREDSEDKVEAHHLAEITKRSVRIDCRQGYNSVHRLD
jgi:hypothetical protein